MTRAERIITFLADHDLFAAIDRAAGEHLLSPAEFVRRYLAAILIPQTEKLQ